MGAKGGKAVHPGERHPAQLRQFTGLGVGAKNCQVGPHFRFEEVVSRQVAAGQAALAQEFEGALLGRPVFEAFFHHQAGGGDCDLFAKRGVHAGVGQDRRRPRVLGARLQTGGQGNSTDPMRATTVAARPLT